MRVGMGGSEGGDGDEREGCDVSWAGVLVGGLSEGGECRDEETYRRARLRL